MRVVWAVECYAGGCAVKRMGERSDGPTGKMQATGRYHRHGDAGLGRGDCQPYNQLQPITGARMQDNGGIAMLVVWCAVRGCHTQ